MTPKIPNGELEKMGYLTRLSEAERNQCLIYAVRQYPPLSVVHYLNSLFLKTKSPTSSTAKVLFDDRNWVINTFLEHKNKITAHHGFPYEWLFEEAIVSKSKLSLCLYQIDRMVQEKLNLNFKIYEKKRVQQILKILRTKEFKERSQLSTSKIKRLQKIVHDFYENYDDHQRKRASSTSSKSRNIVNPHASKGAYSVNIHDFMLSA